MMARALRLGVGGAVAALGAVALAMLSLAPYAAESGEHAVLRLAWRARGERERECRRLTADELARLPPHMRQEEVCERRIRPYRLQVSLDGAPVLDEVVRAGGAREDRPLFVFRDLPVAAGTHRVQILFERAGGEQEHGHEERDARGTPRRLAFDQAVTVAARAIVLVTYDDGRRALRLLAAPDGGP